MNLLPLCLQNIIISYLAPFPKSIEDELINCTRSIRNAINTHDYSNYSVYHIKGTSWGDFNGRH